MSKIEEYKQKKSELQALRQVTTLSITQVIHEAGGAANQFTLEGATPGQTKSFINYVQTKIPQILGAMKDDLRAEVNTLLIEAKAEAAAFTTSSTPEV